MTNLTTTTIAVMVAAIISILVPTSRAGPLFPEVEITLANDGTIPVLYMCQTEGRKDSLYQLEPNSTFRFSFQHIAFPMRWCYLYVNPNNHGFFWAYTIRSRCTKCFWSINKYPSLYRGDKGRWERQNMFMPPDFNIRDFQIKQAEPQLIKPLS